MLIKRNPSRMKISRMAKGALSKHLMLEYITNNVVVYDGGEYMSTVKNDLYTNENIHLLQISNLGLWVTNTKNH
jgi:hypothetical protein